MDISSSIQSLDTWSGSSSSPLIISGPCSAESREQVVETAIALSLIPQVTVFRAGVWKPRTRPGGFEGRGEEALKWLAEAKERTALKIAVEIAKAEHISSCLSHGVDIIWIGARTVVNPFSVEEISNALKGVDIPVMIKNPVTPDIELWLGATERIMKAGITKLAAIHRGFYCGNNYPNRNNPMWEIPVEMKRLMPDLPIICDPSHIAGNKIGLAGISQTALDHMMDGLMIETHIKPENALTDARQQISPVELKELLDKLEIRRIEGQYKASMVDKLRTNIDSIDNELLRILSQRIEVVKELAVEKEKENTTVYQADRWRSLLESRMRIADSMELNRNFILKLMQLVHNESIRIQLEYYKNKKF